MDIMQTRGVLYEGSCDAKDLLLSPRRPCGDAGRMKEVEAGSGRPLIYLIVLMDERGRMF